MLSSAWLYSTILSSTNATRDMIPEYDGRVETKGFTLTGRSLHNHRAGHLGVDGAKVRIRSGFVEGKRELFIGIQHLGLEYFVRAHNRVRNIITICPGDRRSDSHRQARRPKTEIIDFHFRACRLRSFR